MKLYDVSNKVEHRVLHFDTDSVIYVEMDGNPNDWHNKLEDYLVELMDELDGGYIITFLSGGPKNYDYYHYHSIGHW